MNEQRITLHVLPQHFDYITNLLGTANLRYIDVAPILQDWAQQRQQAAQMPIEVPKANGADHAQEVAQ